MANLHLRKDTVDVVVVGCGAGGGVIAKELGEAGATVVVLEAGKRFQPSTDYTIRPG
jgi:choline dehydrogenase-like flavoprotein